MQSIVLYGRFVARAVLSGVSSEIHHSGSAAVKSQARDLHLVTAYSGSSKTQSPAQILRKWSFGDDACFIAGHKVADVVGVADGVGGWRDYGVDPSQFPRSLMDTCERLVREGKFSPSSAVTVIENGYHEILESKAPLLGSCTACIVSLYREQQKVYTANLGDSGFLVIRGGKVIHQSAEQQHYFNTPFQLAIAPTKLQGLVHCDSPSSADSSSFGVQEGDLILVGTDGLFDNMNEEMILGHIRKLKKCPTPESIQKTANALAKHAHELAFDPDYMSPFAINAQENGFQVKGGKPDDITVLLAHVTEKEPQAEVNSPPQPDHELSASAASR